MIIIGGLTLLYVFGNYLSVRYFFDGPLLVGTLFGTAFAPLIILSWFAIGFVVISRLQDNGGSFRRIWTITAYGLLPTWIGGLLTLVAALLATPPTITGAETAVELQQLTTSYYDQPVLRIAGLANSATFLVSGYLWIAGLQWANDCSRRDATIAVVVMLGFSGLYQLSTGQLL